MKAGMRRRSSVRILRRRQQSVSLEPQVLMNGRALRSSDPLDILGVKSNSLMAMTGHVSS